MAVVSAELQLPVWQAPEEIQEALIGVWRDIRKGREQKAIEDRTAAALSRR